MTSAAPLTHERAFELLPWLVNGTLRPAERDAVEQHARSCIICRRELKEQQRLHGAVRAQPTVHVSPETGFGELERTLVTGTRAVRRSRPRYPALRPFAVAAAAGVALLAFLLWLTPLPQPAEDAYSTLAAPPRDAGALIDLVFAEQTTAAEINALLDEIDGEIVAGPSPVGRYSVRLDGALDEATAKRLLAMLAADSRVRFAGRSFAEPPQ